jgi:hypothetical protein
MNVFQVTELWELTVPSPDVGSQNGSRDDSQRRRRKPPAIKLEVAEEGRELTGDENAHQIDELA